MTDSGLALVLVLGFLVYRATRVMTLDSISRPWREFLHGKVQEAGADTRSFARWGYTLLTCPFCSSVHLAFLAMLLYGWLVLDTWLGWEFPFLALAIAGAASLMLSVDMRLNRDAEPGPPLPPG